MKTLPAFGRIYNVSMKLYIANTTENMQNILAITPSSNASICVLCIFTSDNIQKENMSITYLKIYSSVNKTNSETLTKLVSLQTWNDIEIAQVNMADGVYRYLIKLNGVQVVYSINSGVEVFGNVTVYQSSPLIEPTNGQVDELTISTSDTGLQICLI